MRATRTLALRQTLHADGRVSWARYTVTESRWRRLVADEPRRALARARTPRRDLATRTATLDIDSGEDVVCTFTNTKHASLKVVKVTDPASDPQDFDFDLTGCGRAGRSGSRHRSRATRRMPSQQTFPLNAAQLGAHTVTESALAGWDLTESASARARAAIPSTSLANRAATLDIDAGETVVCTFTNTKRAALDDRQGDRSRG